MSLPQISPNHCRTDAYGLFVEQLPALETTSGLLHAAIAVAMHDQEDVDARQIESELASISRTIRRRVRSDRTEAILAHAHEVLFEEEHFMGDVEDYYNPRNSYVPAVLQHRRGIPITLTLVYKAVLEPLGVKVVGVNAPAHFLAGVQEGNSLMLIDPFYGGKLLSRQEVLHRIAATFTQVDQHAAAVVSDVLLAPATHRQWIGRLIMNLVNVFAASGRHQDLAAMLELRDVLHQ